MGHDILRHFCVFFFFFFFFFLSRRRGCWVMTHLPDWYKRKRNLMKEKKESVSRLHFPFPISCSFRISIIYMKYCVGVVTATCHPPPVLCHLSPSTCQPSTCHPPPVTLQPSPPAVIPQLSPDRWGHSLVCRHACLFAGLQQGGEVRCGWGV